MQPMPFFYPGHFPAQWPYAQQTQIQYLHHPWIPQVPALQQHDMPGPMPQYSENHTRQHQADVHGRTLQQAVQASVKN